MEKKEPIPQVQVEDTKLMIKINKLLAKYQAFSVIRMEVEETLSDVLNSIAPLLNSKNARILELEEELKAKVGKKEG